MAAAGAAAGCGPVTRWLDARKARKPPFRAVSPPVASEIVRDAPEVLILDLRRPEDFQGPKGHLRNALNIPLAHLPYRLLELRGYRGETFLVYCDSDECGRAGMRILVEHSDFQDGILIAGGIDGWLRAGFTTFVRASTLHPPNARVKTPRYPELTPGGHKPMDELPVVPPPEKPPAPPRPSPVQSPPPPSQPPSG